MLFNSYIFVFLFFPLVLIGYFGINHFGKYQLANVFLIGMSLWFYGYYNPKYLLVISMSILINYGIATIMNRMLQHENERSAKLKAVFAVGILANVASIFYFKYYDFFIENINSAFHSSFELRHMILPLGISFFTFQQISYLVDTYRGETKDYKFIEYALFVVYFPQLIAGPIVLHGEMLPQIRNQEKRHINFENLSHGLYIFAVGLFKKVIIADTFSVAVNWGYGNIAEMSWIDALIVSFSYTMQLYFDFSGYCDMAVGIGRMMNFELPQNFNSPYKSTTITEFWTRWHMTLSRFLKQYIYFPLGGSRKGKLRTYINVMIVFLVSGIWHGANWTFIVWGLLHGMFNCINRMTKKVWDRIPYIIRWVVNINIVNILFVFFRSSSVSEAVSFFKRMLDFDPIDIDLQLKKCFLFKEVGIIWPDYVFSFTTWRFFMWAFIAIVIVIVMFGKNCYEKKPEFTVKRAAFTILLLVWSIISLNQLSEFLYFGF